MASEGSPELAVGRNGYAPVTKEAHMLVCDEARPMAK
jgi:hypothetical protein